MRTPVLCFVSAFALSAMAQLPGYVPTSGLVAWYPLDNSVVDASGNGLNGTTSGTSAVDNRFGDPGEASAFSGFSYDLVLTNALFNTGAGMTVTAWVNLSDASLNQKVMGRVNGSFNSGYILGVENGQLNPEVWNSAGAAHSFSAGTIPSGAWTHVAITWATSGYLVAYVNGAAADSIAAGTSPIGSNTEPLIIGGSPWSTSPLYFPVNGSIDDIGIWSRALSATEILEVFNAGGTGIKAPAASAGFSIFPNPARTTVSIRTSAELVGERYIVLDAMGRAVSQGALGNGLTAVGVEALPTGVYTIRVGDASVRTLKFVKQ